ncbi:hypothetical protein D3C86_1602100 [compost metagenome]
MPELLPGIRPVEARRLVERLRDVLQAREEDDHEEARRGPDVLRHDRPEGRVDVTQPIHRHREAERCQEAIQAQHAEQLVEDAVPEEDEQEDQRDRHRARHRRQEERHPEEGLAPDPAVHEDGEKERERCLARDDHQGVEGRVAQGDPEIRLVQKKAVVIDPHPARRREQVVGVKRQPEGMDEGPADEDRQQHQVGQQEDVPRDRLAPSPAELSHPILPGS